MKIIIIIIEIKLFLFFFLSCLVMIFFCLKIFARKKFQLMKFIVKAGYNFNLNGQMFFLLN